MNKFNAYLALVVSICCLFASCKKTYYASYTYGPIQAIGNQEKLFVFLEIDRMVMTGESHYDAPGSYPVGHKQELLIFDKSGLSNRIPINTSSNFDGVSFHPNLTKLFAYGGGIYIFLGESYGHKESVFRWDFEKSKFVLLSLEEGRSILSVFGAIGSTSDKWAKLREVSQNAGWSFHYQSTSLAKEEFKWNDSQFHLSTSIKDENLEVLISMDGAADNRTKVLTYPVQAQKLNEKQREELSREESGHPK